MHGVLFPSPAACFMKLNRRRNVANVRRSEDPRTPRLTRRGRRVALIACGSQLPQMIFFFFFAGPCTKLHYRLSSNQKEW